MKQPQTVSDSGGAGTETATTTETPTALTDVVEQLGETPVEEVDYDFGYGTASEFLGVATARENTGVDESMSMAEAEEVAGQFVVS